MIFNKNVFASFVLVVSLLGCALRIGEPSPGYPKFYFEFPNPKNCQELDYKTEFKDYFFNPNRLNSESLKQVLACLSYQIENTKNLISNSFFTKEDIKNLLDDNVIEIGNLKPYWIDILDSDSYTDYLFIKNNIVKLMVPDFNKQNYHSQFTCKSNTRDEALISKIEVDQFLKFIEVLSEFFVDVESDADSIYQSFFKDQTLYSKSSLHSRGFIEFLFETLIEVSPAYSEFLKEQTLSTTSKSPRRHRHRENAKIRKNTASLLETLLLFSNSATKQKSLDIQQAQQSLKQPLNRGKHPLNGGKHPLNGQVIKYINGQVITSLNVKYMMLHVYIMKVFFQVYDLNEDFILDTQELKPLVCMINPILAVILSEKLKDQWNIVKNLYSPEVVMAYILSKQEMPPEKISGPFFWFSYWHSEDFSYNLSHYEISRLVHLLLKLSYENLTEDGDLTINGPIGDGKNGL